MLEVGAKAPEFALESGAGTTVTLAQFAGRRVVLYFYPRDNTPGCTRQAAAFASAYESFCALGVEVIGISKDSVTSHQKFAQKHGLPFLLLSDPDHRVLEDYHVWQEKKLYGKVSMGVVRTTFLIAPDGTIELVMPKVKPDTNAQLLLDYLQGEK